MPYLTCPPVWKRTNFIGSPSYMATPALSSVVTRAGGAEGAYRSAFASRWSCRPVRVISLLSQRCPYVGSRLSPPWTVLRRLVPSLLCSLAILKHDTVPSRHLVVLRTAGPIIDLATAVAND